MNTKLFAVLAAGVLGATVAQANSVESANIVGYQTIKIQPGYTLFTVTFKDVNKAEYDIQDVKVLNADGTDYASNNKIKVQKVEESGNYGTTYNYRLSKGGWCQANTFIGADIVKLADGEGVALHNGDAVDVYLQVSGAVNLNPVSTPIPATSYKIIGNPTPSTIDIQDVIPYIGTEVCSANNKVKIQKVKINGDYDTTYNFRLSKGGWCSAATFIGRDVLKLEPGEAIAVYNGEASAITLKFPSPISE